MRTSHLLCMLPTVQVEILVRFNGTISTRSISTHLSLRLAVILSITLAPSRSWPVPKVNKQQNVNHTHAC